MFFNNLHRFSTNVALCCAESNRVITYAELNELISLRKNKLGDKRELVFIEAHTSIETIVDYIACLQLGKVVYLTESVNSDKTKDLIELYEPNILIGHNSTIIRNSEREHELHDNLCLLMSTSGSTGSPKFVKLSQHNICSNAESICEYLNLDQTEKAYLHLKLHYSYGISILNSHLNVGACVVLTNQNILDQKFWHDLTKYEATSFAGVPYTFETLLHSQFDINQYPTLRYVTQAGGKLEKNLVVKFLDVLQNKTELFIMYGQTEASPRISYLPPELAHKYPDSIGKAIPGGKLSLVKDSHSEILELNQEGELRYEGPNIMMGYASNPTELYLDQTPEFLLTGDIAYKNSDGLYCITGRTKRFVKPFGVRVNLDDVQTYVKQFHAKCAITGDDSKLIIAMEGSSEEAVLNLKLIQQLSDRYKLPASIFKIVHYTQLPLMSSNKYDFKAILHEYTEVKASHSFVSKIKKWVYETLELDDSNWSSIHEMYITCLDAPKATKQDSFDSIGADSLSYVELSMELEQILGLGLPLDWKSKTIGELEAIYSQQIKVEI